MSDEGSRRANEAQLRRPFFRQATRDGFDRRQGGVCAICEQPPPPGDVLHLDHDHKTGHARGLLCRQCNTALGLLDDDIDRIEAAIDYLLRPARQRMANEIRILLAQPPETQ